MFKLIYYIVDSQRDYYSRLWIFSFSRPSKYQSKFRERWFFNPFFSLRLRRYSKKSLYRRLHNYRLYPFLSIFIDVNVLFDRYTAFRNAVAAYKRWVLTQSRWYKKWDRWWKPRVLPYFWLFSFYIGVAALGLMWPRIFLFFKKKIWLGYLKSFLSFVWFGILKKVFFFIFYFVYISFESLSVWLVFVGLFFFCCWLFFLFKKIILFYWGSFFLFERGLAVSNSVNYRVGAGLASRFSWDLNRTAWRLSSFLETRYVKVLERFESQQFPFKFDDETFADYAGVRSTGWLRCNSPFSRLTFQSNFIPYSVGSFFKKKFFRWRFLPLPLAWVGVWGRYPYRRINRFYAHNLILYRPFGEVCLVKSSPLGYGFFLASYLEKYRSCCFSLLNLVVLKSYPWWVYRRRLMSFLFVIRFSFFYFLGLFADERPFRGDLVKLYRRRRRKIWFYILAGYYTVARPVSRLFFNQPVVSKIYSRALGFYTEFWILVFCCLDPFSWLLMFPIKFRIRLKKNTFVCLAFLLLGASCLLILKYKVLLLVFLA